MNALTVEFLEQRRLLSLSLAGPPTSVAGATDASTFAAAVAGNGSSIIAFVAPGTTGDLQAIRYSPTGEQIGSPITLASGKPVGGFYFLAEISVAMDDSGDAVVAWYQVDSVDGDSNPDKSLHFERISSAGVASAPVAVAGADFSFDQPSVSMDSAGGFFLGWVRQEQEFDDPQVTMQAFDAGGTALAPSFIVHTAYSSGDEGISNISVAAKPDGSGAVVAFAENFEGAPDDLQFCRVSKTAVIGTISSIDSDPDGDLGENSPDFAVNADGSFELAYTTYGDEINNSYDAALWIQRFSADGVAQGDAIAVSPVNEAAVSADDDVIDAISIDSLPGDGFIAAYAQFSGTTDGPVFVQRFDATGAPDSDGPLQVAAQGVPVIGTDADGNAVVAFGNAYIGFTATEGNPLNFVPVSTTTDFASDQDGLLSITGTAGDDAISVAVSGSNLIVTRNGDSRNFAAADVTAIRVDGFDGNDALTNSTSIPSSLYGGAGKDVLIGGGRSDLLSGGGGDDQLSGGAGNDRLYGGDGRDHLYGGSGDDQLFGGAGGDWLYSQNGNDNLNGEGGRDRLYADYDSGVATLHGGAGDDILVTRDANVDHLFGDGGNDSSVADSTDLLTSIESAA